MIAGTGEGCFRPDGVDRKKVASSTIVGRGAGGCSMVARGWRFPGDSFQQRRGGKRIAENRISTHCHMVDSSAAISKTSIDIWWCFCARTEMGKVRR